MAKIFKGCYFEQNFLGDSHDEWFSWGLNQIPWRQAENEQWRGYLPRLSAYYPQEEIPDRLSAFLSQANQQFWLELSSCSCFLLKNEDHKIGWKAIGAMETLLLGISHSQRKILVKPIGAKRSIPFELKGGDILVLPPETEFSIPRTKQKKETFMLLAFGD